MCPSGIFRVSRSKVSGFGLCWYVFVDLYSASGINKLGLYGFAFRLLCSGLPGAEFEVGLIRLKGTGALPREQLRNTLGLGLSPI